MKSDLDSTSHKEGYLADADWVDSWLRHFNTGYTRINLFREGEVSKDINKDLVAGYRNNRTILIDCKRKVYLLNDNVWNYLVSLFTSGLTLVKRKGKIRAHYKNNTEYTIENQEEVNFLRTHYIKKNEATKKRNGQAQMIHVNPPYKVAMSEKSNNGFLKHAPSNIEEEEVIDEQHTSAEAKAVGIVNHESNCYINAGMQCLLCISELYDYFLKEKYKNIRYETKKNKDICKKVTTFFNSTLQKSVVDPKSFMALCNPGQQDVHEFFWKILFPLLQEEMNPAKSERRSDMWGSDETWAWYKRYNKSIIDNLFGGLYKSSLTCKECEHISITYDPFLEISLHIARNQLKGCLEQEFDEVMAKEYKCLNCKKVTDVKKTTVIDRSPKYLILHLKRLVNGRKKISSMIDYEEHLDISKYCISVVKNIFYKLVAVCVHNGGSSHGHYYAIGRRGTKVLFPINV